jgi:hypothetical protein
VNAEDITRAAELLQAVAEMQPPFFRLLGAVNQSLDVRRRPRISHKAQSFILVRSTAFSYIHAVRMPYGRSGCLEHYKTQDSTAAPLAGG